MDLDSIRGCVPVDIIRLKKGRSLGLQILDSGACRGNIGYSGCVSGCGYTSNWPVVPHNRHMYGYPTCKVSDETGFCELRGVGFVEISTEHSLVILLATPEGDNTQI